MQRGFIQGDGTQLVAKSSYFVTLTEVMLKAAPSMAQYSHYALYCP